MDSGLTMEKQVNAISKSCFYHIRNIGKVKQYITNDTVNISRGLWKRATARYASGAN